MNLFPLETFSTLPRGVTVVTESHEVTILEKPLPQTSYDFYFWHVLLTLRELNGRKRRKEKLTPQETVLLEAVREDMRPMIDRYHMILGFQRIYPPIK